MSVPPGNGGRGWRHRNRGVLVGGILIIVGVYALLNNLGLIPEITWEIVWPVLLIVVGVWFILQRRT